MFYDLNTTRDTLPPPHPIDPIPCPMPPKPSSSLGVSAMTAGTVVDLTGAYVGDEAVAMRPVLPVIVSLVVSSVDL